MEIMLRPTSLWECTNLASISLCYLLVVERSTRFDPNEFIYIASKSHCYTFQTAHAMNFLFLTHHTTLCENIFGVLQKHSTNIIKSDIPWGAKPPHHHVQLGAFKLLQIQCT